MSMFLGWMPDAATQAALADLQQGIRAALPADAPRHDWRTPAQWHLTLRFLGESISDGQRGCIDDALRAFTAQATPAEASLVGARYWSASHVLVADIDASAALKSLLEDLETSMQDCGFAKGRTQIAHVTLAHLPRDTRTPALPPIAIAIPTTSLSIDRIHLLRTDPGGYMSLASWPLAGGSTDA